MRKMLMLTAAALLVPGVAFADGEEGSKTGWYYSAAAGWTNMDMPDHANAAVVVDLGGGLEPFVAQADVDGVSYGFGLGYESASGWRFGGSLRFSDLDGASSDAVSFDGAVTPFRRGTLAGLTQAAGPVFSAGPVVGSLDLDVTVDTSAVGISFGRALGHMLRADLVVNYDLTDTAYRNTLDVVTLGAAVVGTENTDFESRTIELAGRLSTAFGLTSDLSMNLGGSAGWALRDIDMAGRQRLIIGGGLVSNSTIKLRDDDIGGFIGRLDASLNYSISSGAQLGVGAVYVYDDMVPVFVPPVYPAAGTGSAATFNTEAQSSLTYGVRLSGKF